MPVVATSPCPCPASPCPCPFNVFETSFVTVRVNEATKISSNFMRASSRGLLEGANARGPGPDAPSSVFVFYSGVFVWLGSWLLLEKNASI